MTESGTSLPSQFFTVRLWFQEVAVGQQVKWRGRVTHVLSGETRHFREWSVLVDFLSTMLMDGRLMRPETARRVANNSGGDEMDEEHAQRYCMMVSQEADEGTSGSAVIWYLDWLDDQGMPHMERLDDHYQGFKKLGADGWRLVQVIERPAAEGAYDGSVAASTYYYFSRPARERG